MSTSKHLERICSVIMIVTVLITLCFINADKLGVKSVSASLGYEDRIFDSSIVHTIDITMDDWDEFIDNAETETYYNCDMVIDGEAFNNIAIRGKGNTSLTSVSAMDSERYSFKAEFDHYDDTKTYYGLDKLCLNNLIQDKTYMKDFITYQMMNEFGVASPLCSFAYITVNGDDWGLYLAVEGVEDSFLRRNYGNDAGILYKPDSQSFGGGKGLGMDFRMSEFINKEESDDNSSDTDSDRTDFSPGMPDFMNGQGSGQGGPPGSGGMGSDDVKLKYIDDDPDSYSNIFDSAKKDIDNADKKRLISSLKSLNEYKDLEDVLDIDEVIRYFVVHNFVVNGDSYTGSMIHNYYLYEKDGKMQMIPWDYNLAFGTFMGNDADSAVNMSIDSPIISGGMGPKAMQENSEKNEETDMPPGNNTDSSDSPDIDDRPMVGWIFSSEKYTEMYHGYFKEFTESILDTGYVTDLILKTGKMIDPYVERQKVSFYEYEDFKKGYPVLKEFIELRTQSVEGQLDGKIPSTQEGQDADSSSLIDASDIDVSMLGSMSDTNMGGENGQGPPDFGNMPTPPDGFGFPGSTKGSDDGSAAGGNVPTPPDNTAASTSGAEDTPAMPAPPGMDFSAEAEGQQGTGVRRAVTGTDCIYIGVSALGLMAGLLFAISFRRRKKG